MMTKNFTLAKWHMSVSGWERDGASESQHIEFFTCANVCNHESFNVHRSQDASSATPKDIWPILAHMNIEHWHEVCLGGGIGEECEKFMLSVCEPLMSAANLRQSVNEWEASRIEWLNYSNERGYLSYVSWNYSQPDTLTHARTDMTECTARTHVSTNWQFTRTFPLVPRNVVEVRHEYSFPWNTL